MNRVELTPKEKRDKVIELILTKEYGETATYDELNEILQEDLTEYYGKTCFRRQMNKVKNELFSKGYVIRPIFNTGYYILKPNQISSYTYRNYITKPLNSFKKARTILDNTTKKDLKGQEITEYKTTCELNEAMLYASTELLHSDEYKILAKNERNKNNG